MATTLVTIVHVFVCLVLVGVVLLQQGKGADMGAAFGGGSQTLFGAAGADNLLTRVTTFCAVVFMITSIILALGSKHAVSGGSSLFQEAPAAPITEKSASGSAANPSVPATQAGSENSPAAAAPQATAPATTTAAPASTETKTAPESAPQGATPPQ